MNLRKPNANSAIGTFNRSRSVVPMSGLCADCLDGCKGGCEVWLASFRGRETLYPGPFGESVMIGDNISPGKQDFALVVPFRTGGQENEFYGAEVVFPPVGVVLDAVEVGIEPAEEADLFFFYEGKNVLGDEIVDH